jgi:hypothetical protein
METVEVTPWTRIRKVLDSNLGRDTSWSDLGFRGLPQSLQANARTLSRLGHDQFLPNPFRFIIHLSSYHSVLYNVASDSVVNKEITHMI